MNATFMNSENSKTSEPYRLLINLSDKVNLKAVINMLLYQIMLYLLHMEKYKKSSKSNRFKIWIIFCIRYPRLF